MWGGEKIMEPRNPDGSQAAALIEQLAACLHNAVGALEGFRISPLGGLPRMKDVLEDYAKARGETQ